VHNILGFGAGARREGGLDPEQRSFMREVRLFVIQGGSDKSGIFFFFLLNGIIQLKISRFY
jgi:hypothetical protein